MEIGVAGRGAPALPLLGAAGAALPLELFVRRGQDGVTEVRAYGLRHADFAAFFADALGPRTCVLLGVPPRALAGDYWEPAGREIEEHLRDAFGVVWRMERGDAVMIWRMDKARKDGRAFEGAAPEGLAWAGRGVALPGGELVKLAASCRALSAGRLEWVAGNVPTEESAVAAWAARASDALRAGSLAPEADMAFTTDADLDSRVLVRDGDWLRRAVEGVLRGFVQSLAGTRCALIPPQAVDAFVRVTSGLGVVCAPPGDVRVTRRTVEIFLRIGAARWSPPGAAEDMASPGEGRLVLYYDRTSGIWQLAG